MSSIFSFFFDFLGFSSCISLLCCLITFSVPQQKIRGSWTLLIPAFSSSQSTSSLIFSSCPYQISEKLPRQYKHFTLYSKILHSFLCSKNHEKRGNFSTSKRNNISSQSCKAKGIACSFIKKTPQ